MATAEEPPQSFFSRHSVNVTLAGTRLIFFTLLAPKGQTCEMKWIRNNPFSGEPSLIGLEELVVFRTVINEVSSSEGEYHIQDILYCLLQPTKISWICSVTKLNRVLHCSYLQIIYISIKYRGLRIADGIISQCKIYLRCTSHNKSTKCFPNIHTNRFYNSLPQIAMSILHRCLNLR